MFLRNLQTLMAKKRTEKPIPGIGINLDNIQIYCTKIGRTHRRSKDPLATAKFLDKHPNKAARQTSI